MEIQGFRDLSPAGHGDVDERYAAVRESDGTAVTLRVLTGTDERLGRRAEREVEAAQRIGDHPNVVAVIDHGVTGDGRPWLAVERCPSSLADELEAGRTWSAEEVAAVGTQLAAGLQAAHAAGVLHRDITPTSVLLDDAGTPKLTGFGISAMEGGAATAALSFTPVHTAPEVIEGREATEATDVYQLASVLFTMVEGRPPFGDASDGTATVLNRILTAEPPTPGGGVPAPLASALHQALSKDPAARPASAGALGDQLGEVGAPSAPAPPPSAPAPPAPTPQPAPPAPAPPAAQQQQQPPPPAAQPAPPAPAQQPAPPAPAQQPAPPAPAPQPAPAPAPPPAAAPPAPAPVPAPAPASSGGFSWGLLLIAVVVAVAVGVIVYLLLA